MVQMTVPSSYWKCTLLKIYRGVNPHLPTQRKLKCDGDEFRAWIDLWIHPDMTVDNCGTVWTIIDVRKYNGEELPEWYCHYANFVPVWKGIRQAPPIRVNMATTPLLPLKKRKMLRRI